MINMKEFVFNIPTKIVFGNSTINQINHYIDSNIEKVLIVTDHDVFYKSGAVEKIQKILKVSELSVFHDVEENPSFELINMCGQMARKNKIDLIIGVGGGSPMDAAKGIALLAANKKNIEDYLNGKKLKRDPLPIICVPTTSGTGSEVTPYTVFTDRKNNIKCGYSNEKLFPYVSIIDPELTFTMPENVIINTGLDALTHSIEAYFSTKTFPLNDVIAINSIETVIKNLRAAANKNKEAMNKMSYASMLAGVAIAHSSTILLHIMAYPLTVFYNIPHGKANAILLPEFMRFMENFSLIKNRVIKIKNMFPGSVEDFVNSFNISTKLRDYKISRSDFEFFVKSTIIKSDIKITPAKIAESDILNIYKRAY
jgi:alcohol dehydrogenase class IV